MFFTVIQFEISTYSLLCKVFYMNKGVCVWRMGPDERSPVTILRIGKTNGHWVKTFSLGKVYCLRPHERGVGTWLECNLAFALTHYLLYPLEVSGKSFIYKIRVRNTIPSQHAYCKELWFLNKNVFSIKKKIKQIRTDLKYYFKLVKRNFE